MILREAMETLAGESLHRECGYAEIERTAASLVGGVAVPLIRMTKVLRITRSSWSC
jgi:hypothetical protein